jgi:hypothetical protein
MKTVSTGSSNSALPKSDIGGHPARFLTAPIEFAMFKNTLNSPGFSIL